ncbi:MAG: type III pantothenate kinase [Deltaproteobacteria bacterium]|jgi:type III pantothenate kinase|nr:type III pantothenate kinase [Deltaproteobacteria bacterium]
MTDDIFLLADIGNTSIKLGFGDKNGIRHSFSLPGGNSTYTSDSLGLLLLRMLECSEYAPEEITAALACSVVPDLEPPLRQACKKYLGRDLILVPSDLPIPLENRYAEPLQVGADRLVGAYAARMLFPAPASIICVDYGTATTFDCVEGNTYLGGLICPGVLSSASALSSRTAKLPQITLETEDRTPIPGRSTSVSMNHGFIFGFAAMTEGLCARLAEGLARPNFVLATGGFASHLEKVSSCFDALRPELLLEGLRILYVNTEQ